MLCDRNRYFANPNNLGPSQPQLVRQINIFGFLIMLLIWVLSEIEDCTREWTFPENEFDYIHIRYLIGCITNWHQLFKEAYRCTKPGGFFETYEASPHVYSDDNTLPENSATAQWGPLFINGGKTIGRSFTVVDEDLQKKAMEEAGFVDIQETRIKVGLSYPYRTTGNRLILVAMIVPNRWMVIRSQAQRNRTILFTSCFVGYWGFHPIHDNRSRLVSTTHT